MKPGIVQRAEAEQWLRARGWEVRFPVDTWYFVRAPGSVRDELIVGYALVRIAKKMGYPYRWWKPSTWGPL